jgi:F-box/TPR repeat protein Pof3
MEQLHKKLEDRMNLNRKDPFTMLPLEMAALVIEHFSFKNIVYVDT